MKHWILVSIVAAVGVGAAYVLFARPTTRPLSPAPASTAVGETVQLAELSIPVEGMTCSLCTVSVEKALLQVPGAKEVKADASKSNAVVKYDPKEVADVAAFRTACQAAIEKTGYRVPS